MQPLKLIPLLLSLAVSAEAQIPVSILGVTDRQVAVNALTWRVQSAGGYTYSVLLDGQRQPTDVDVTVTNADYHELRVAVTNTATGAGTNALVRFLIQSSARGTAEWGLPPWVPYPIVNSTAAELAEAHLRLWVPEAYPAGLEIPVVAWLENQQGKAVRANALLTAEGHTPIQLRRGAGAGYLKPSSAGRVVYAASVPGLQTNREVQVEESTAWNQVGGMLTGNVVWPAHSRVAVVTNLTVPAGASLTIGEGTVVKLNYRVNITNTGAICIRGTEQHPVVFTPTNRSLPWGGFFMCASTGSIEASGTIFVASGADPNAGAGHKTQQCLFFIDERPRLALTNCAAIDLAGQFGHAASAMTNSTDPAWTVVNIDHSLIQRCVTGGEWSGCDLRLVNSALLETPYATPVFADGDEDGIYFMYGEFLVQDTVIGWTRDDGIDAGSGNGSLVTASNVWIESTFHEGFAWSGGGGTTGIRRAVNRHCVTLNCGQGIECGWSSGGTSYSPDVLAVDSLVLGNEIGLRFGDNYPWSFYGFLRATNCLLLYNAHDVWGYNWQTDANGWIYRTANMDIRSNYLSAPNPRHPDNQLWNPASDGWRLAEFLSIPPAAPVGIAVATWTNQFPMPALFQGVPVGLSCFTTNPVAVDYTFEDDNAVLASGTLTFAPGETVKRFYPAGFDLAGRSLVRARLRGATGGEFTGPTNIVFLGNAPAPRISLSVGGTQMALARLGEGLSVVLDSPSAVAVRADYRWEIPGGVLSFGSLTFAPGQQRLWLDGPGTDPQDSKIVRLVLSDPLGAELGQPAEYHFVKSAAAAAPAAVTLVAAGPGGAWWKYDDSVTNEVAGWYGTAFDDAAWKRGRSSLGYDNSPAQTTTVGYGPSSSAKYMTTRFRGYFDLTNATQWSSLTFNLLRDDGAVVYLNGAELYRENLPAAPAVIAITTPATTNISGTATTWSARTFTTTGLPALLREGTNLVAVEIHQNNGGSSDILFDLGVTGLPQPPPAPTPQLYWGRFDGRLTLAWEGTCQLLQATNVTGPYTNSPVLTSPTILNPTDSRRFFRLSVP